MEQNNNPNPTEPKKINFRCPICKRVCISIESDGICASPKCRKGL